jgi:hypothetical protein
MLDREGAIAIGSRTRAIVAPDVTHRNQIELLGRIGEISSNGETLHNARGQVRKRFLSIPKARILDSSVERGMHSLTAAPKGPNTRPPVARNASSMIAFS